MFWGHREPGSRALILDLINFKQLHEFWLPSIPRPLNKQHIVAAWERLFRYPAAKGNLARLLSDRYQILNY